MIELLTSMWGFLAGAGILGLIVGWAIRGVFIPRAKTVNVTSQTLSDVPVMTAEDRQKLDKADRAALALTAAQERLVNMEEKLEAARKESEIDKSMIMQLEQEKDALAAVSVEAPAEPSDTEPAPQAVTLSEDEHAENVWKTRYLTSRVRFLESKLEPKPVVEAPAPVVTPDPEMEAELAAVKAENGELKDKLAAAEAAPAVPATPDPSLANDAAEMAGLNWQNRYLRARVNHLENSAAAPLALVETPVEDDTNAEALVALEAENSRLKKDLSASNEGTSQSEQEMARLRWRNRYLEGRLKYLEAASLDAESEADDSIHPASAPEPVEMETVAETAEPEAPPAEPVEEVRPSSYDAPVGEPDDLKLIGGVGPKIEGILNGLGIFHFSQIASWTPGEEAWIDSYLRFQGRVMREKWVEQANSLNTAASA